MRGCFCSHVPEEILRAAKLKDHGRGDAQKRLIRLKGVGK
ncbi:hypothetical protein DCCM_3779 [Desulfocucumis palustris]|uniref:Uncharacterized protein n=1 Tax=Desulfocucumis palustris TaxID=1898651 RepID=A0A2L2XE69_9FIRM|nr:hypothetical protein DCCM_3779 [Desulfocucumis palustris]